MPIPFAIPAAGLLGKAALAAKGLVMGAKGKAVLGGLRMAGSKIAPMAKSVVAKGMPTSATEGLVMFAPDAIGGAMVGAATPGDLADKLIAGGASAIGGAGGGVLARGALPGKLIASGSGAAKALQYGVDYGGSIGGDMLGMQVGDQILRAKGGGLTPYERLIAEGNEEQRRLIEEDVYRQLIGGSQAPYAQNPFGGSVI